MSQEAVFRFLQRKVAVSTKARDLLITAVEAGCHGAALKSFSSFIEEIDSEVNSLSAEANQIDSTGQYASMHPSHWEKLTKHHYRQPPSSDNPVTLDNYLNQNE